MHNDILEIVVEFGLDGHFKFHGVHAQNFHVLTPADGKPWTMVWGANQWIYELPWANAASSYDFLSKQ